MSIISLPRIQQLALLFLLLLFTGCNQQEKSQDTSVHSQAIKQQQSNGPLSAQMLIQSEQINLADNLILTLTATTPEDYHVSFPEFSTTAGDFDLVDTTSSPKKLSNSLVSQSMTLTLSPFLQGDYNTPEIKISAATEAKGSALLEVTFQPQTITVHSLLEESAEEPAMTDIYEPLSLATPIWYFVVAGLLVLLIVTLVFFLIRRKKSHKKIIPQIPAHITALTAIDRLLGEKADTGHSLFFAKLSLILRHYIEERFYLKAPEQTTEEFLIALGHTPMFSTQHKELLKNFLHRSDLIKFAKITPSQAEIMDSVQSCQNFIQATGEKQGGTS